MCRSPSVLPLGKMEPLLHKKGMVQRSLDVIYRTQDIGYAYAFPSCSPLRYLPCSAELGYLFGASGFLACM